MLLVTTSYKEVYNTSDEIIYLGEWCTTYLDSNKPKVKYQYVKPYGIEFEKIEENNKIIKSYEVDILKHLSKILNEIHEEDNNLRYWRIILGHWINRYVTVCLNRWNNIKQALEVESNIKTVIFKDDKYNLITLDSLSFIWACNDPIWNHVLYSKIIENYDIDKKYLKRRLGCGYRMNKSNFSILSKAKKLSKIIASNILNRFCRENDALIIGSYLSRMSDIKLNFALGQIPQIWNSPIYTEIEPDIKLRGRYKKEIIGELSFEKFLYTTILEILPTCYLESYKHNKKNVKNMGFPTNPKFIFTSSRFDTDEIEKLYISEQVTKGIPYYIGQHGGAYGTAAEPYTYAANESQLLNTCDKFLTWGWHNDTKCRPAFIFKNNLNKFHYNKMVNKNLLLIETCLLHRIQSFDQYPFFSQYQNDQFDFVRGLEADIKNKLIVRLNLEYMKHTWKEDVRWREFDSQINVESGKKNIYKLIQESKLVVHSYDGTTMLETLSQNIPTICFWSTGLSRLRESAIPFYQTLKTVGILYDSPIHASLKINEIWNNVDEWWSSNLIQDARIEFCNQYARITNNPIKHLKKLLMS